MSNMTDYVTDKGITVEIVKDRGMQVEDGWEHHAYVIRLFRDGGLVRSPKFDWRAGTALGSVTDMADAVLDALVSDSLSYLDSAGFEDWASDLGYDTDSRKAEKAYQACGVVADWLPDFLGGQEEFDHVAYETERL